MAPYEDGIGSDVHSDRRSNINRFDDLLPVPPDFFPGSPTASPTMLIPLYNGMHKRRIPDRDDTAPLGS